MRAFERILTAAFIFAVLLATASILTGCNESKSINAAVPNVARPYLRDTVRKEDVTCLDEPDGDPQTQKQANQLTKDKIAWGRSCKRASDLGWTMISQEP